jgi:predicted kinase
MIINIRGASGAGKTTVVRSLIGDAKMEPLRWSESRNPNAYAVRGLFNRDVFILGSYETTCGGCDAIATQDEVCDGVRKLAKFGHVIFEGLLVGKISQRYHDLSVELGGIKFLFLDTPLELCLERVRGRRAERGDGREFNTKNTESAHRQCARSYELLKQAGSDVAWLNHENPAEQIKQLINQHEATSEIQYLGAQAALELYNRTREHPHQASRRKPAALDGRPGDVQAQLL